MQIKKTHMGLLLSPVNQIVAFHGRLIGISGFMLRHNVVRVVGLLVLDLFCLSLHGGC